MAKENNNKSFVLRIDAATMEALEGWAADEFRSINGQLQWIIADALRRSGRGSGRPYFFRNTEFMIQCSLRRRNL